MIKFPTLQLAEAYALAVHTHLQLSPRYIADQWAIPQEDPLISGVYLVPGYPNVEPSGSIQDPLIEEIEEINVTEIPD